MTAPQLPQGHFLRRLPLPLKRFLNAFYWSWYDARDFVAEAVGWCPFHNIRLFLYRHLLRVRIGRDSSVHRLCRFYCPSGVHIGANTIINRGVLLDGRRGLTIGQNVSVSEDVTFLTLEHDPNSPTFGERGAPIVIHNRAFIGAQAMILPGVTIGEGAIVAARAVVTHDVAPFTIVAGVPARPIGKRARELIYTLNYRKFLG